MFMKIILFITIFTLQVGENDNKWQIRISANKQIFIPITYCYLDNTKVNYLFKIHSVK